MDQNIEKDEEQKMDEKRIKEDWSFFTLKNIEKILKTKKEPALGYLIWVKSNFGEKKISEHISALKARGIKYLRTNISWADWINPTRKEWIINYIREYSQELHILPCLSFTPPELGIKHSVNSPPKSIEAYELFVDDVINELGDCFNEVELWNEWNLGTDWDRELDPDYSIFIEMIHGGLRSVHSHGKRAVLGGLTRLSERTTAILNRFSKRLPFDVIGFHNLRGTWSDQIPAEPLRIQKEKLLKVWGKNIPVYLTEYGFPIVDPENRFSYDYLEDIQVALFAYATYVSLVGDVDRVYWYTYKDYKSPSLRYLTTGWEDILQFHFGDTREDGKLRKLGKLLLEGGPKNVLLYAVKNNLMHLVDEASLGRKIPKE